VITLIMQQHSSNHCAQARQSRPCADPGVAALPARRSVYRASWTNADGGYTFILS
jgi:hypothetical protein